MNLELLSLVSPLALHFHTVLGTHSLFLLLKQVPTGWHASFRPLCLSSAPQTWQPVTRKLKREHFDKQPRSTQVMPTYEKQTNFYCHGLTQQVVVLRLMRSMATVSYFRNNH